MVGQIDSIIRRIQDEQLRFNYIKSRLSTHNFTEAKLFIGPFGKSNQDEFMRKIDATDSLVACLKATVDDIEKITDQECKLRISKDMKNERPLRRISEKAMERIRARA